MSWFKSDPVRKIRKAYEAKMKEAMEAQRGGSIQGYAKLYTEAEALLAQVQAAEAKQG